MSWLTPDQNMDEDSMVDLYLRAGMSRVDNVFQMSRRAFNSLERPLGTSSGQNTVWHGYQPYNPALVEKYLCIFRVVNNFIVVGTDGKTPASITSASPVVVKHWSRTPLACTTITGVSRQTC